MMHAKHQDLIENIKQEQKITEEIENKLKEIYQEFTNQFVL